jgi:ferredoxin
VPSLQASNSSTLQRAWSRLEAGFNVAFGSAGNPFHHLGALTIYFFWIALATGLYLFLFFEITVFGAYHSIERLTHDQWYLGGIVRSLHRYASEAAMFTMALHVLREFLLGRYRGFRWYTWFTGVPVLWFVFLLGITGHWLVWDVLAQYIATTTAELMDWLPVFSDQMARNFITPAALSDRFFIFMAFLHMLGLPLMLAFGTWFHVLRTARPNVNPPRALMLGSLAALLVLALLKPAVSLEFADLTRVPGRLELDWFYLGLYPVMDMTSPAFAWAVLIGTTALLGALPLLPGCPPLPPPPPARVDLDHCNGCGRCADDCPYGAITMTVRTDGRPFARHAEVEAALCAGCGVCVGSCPSSTPFRRVERLVTGIDLPDPSLQDLRDRSAAALDACSGTQKILVYGCDHAVDVTSLQRRGVCAVSLPCAGMLPPPMIDYALRVQGAAGVLVTGCGKADCHFRLGGRWTEERIAGAREPRLRERVERKRLHVCWASAVERDVLLAELDAFRVSLEQQVGSERTGAVPNSPMRGEADLA